MRLRGRNAVVTGGNTGIGSAITRAYAAEGANVAIAWYRDREAAEALALELRDAGQKAAAIECDVTNEASVEALFSNARKAVGPINLLVNNAGIQQPGAIDETSVDDFDRMLAVHLRGAFLCSRGVLSQMKAAGNGRIINVCSQLGYIGRGNYTAYSTAKGGLIAFTRALAQELAPDILVNGVSPGLIDTGFDPLSEEQKSEHAAGLPLERLGVPEDMTSAFVFLASDDARYFCGQMLHPNGGEIMP